MTATIDVTGEAPPGASALPPAAAPAARHRPSLVPLVRRLHFYAGILVAPFLVIAALTGLVYVFAPQIDRVAYHDQLYVSHVGVGRLPVIEQIHRAEATAPEGSSFAYVILPADRDKTTRVVFDDPGLTGDRQRTIYVDPYSGAVKGSLATWFDSTPAVTWTDDLHRNLHLGAFGRYYTEIAASWLAVLVLGGFYLWFSRNRRARRRARSMLLPESSRKGARRTRSLHAVTGLWISVVLLFLAATGLTWSRHAGAHFSSALDQLNASTPALPKDLPAGSPPAAGVTTGSGDEATFDPDPSAVDTVVAGARDHGSRGRLIVTPPGKASEAWSVAEWKDQWPVQYDRVAVDGTGRVVAEENFADRPLLAKFTKLGVQGHMGRLFGWGNQILLGVVAVGLIFLIAMGYRTWWHRRPTGADRRAPMGDAPDRGTWRQAHAWQVALVVVLAAAVGWAVPLLGITLAAFLAFDGIVGVVRRAQDREALRAARVRTGREAVAAAGPESHPGGDTP
jgi:uncharacterized iron-regulated membrane protein